MKLERVLAIHNYHDGPLIGVAELGGVPHIFEREFDEVADEYRRFYFLSPVAPELLELILEDLGIWLRWEAAFGRGEATIESHPALPEDRARHIRLWDAIGDRFKSDPANRVAFNGIFDVEKQSVAWMRI